MSSNIWEANKICQIHGVRHPDGIMHIAAATLPVGASFGPPEDTFEGGAKKRLEDILKEAGEVKENILE